MSTSSPLRWLLVVRLLLSLAPLVFGVAWGVRESHPINRSDIALSEGFRYAVVVPSSAYEPLFDIDGDGLRHARRAATRVYEDGRRLGPAHQPHDYIRQSGLGQFSHWGSTLHFSSSDNTDPRTNGRSYTIVTSATLPFAVTWVWLLIVAASTGLAVSWPPTPSGTTAPSRPIRAGVATALIVILDVVVARDSLSPTSGEWMRGGAVLQGLWTLSLLIAGILAWQIGDALARLGPSLMRETGEMWRSLSVRAARPFSAPGWHGRLARAVSLVVPFAVYALLLRVVLPIEVLTVAYYFVTPLAVPFGLALWASYSRRDWLGTLAALTVTLALFALPLAALWQHLGSHYNAVGGLLPFSDASGYYFDARRLIDGHPFGWSARRPLFPGLFAAVLALTAENLQLTIAVFVCINAIACFLLARELRKSHGPVAAAASTLVLYLYYRVEGGCGTTLTENLGFAMGMVAFAVLWRAGGTRRIRGLCLGLGLLTIALMARAGAFFVLPGLVLAAAWAFRSNRGWLRVGLSASVAIVLAAILVLGLGKLLSDPKGDQKAFSNFSYSLYGLVVGGKGWGQVLTDHPTATEGAQIYSLAWQAFRARPMGLVVGSLRMWRAYLCPAEPYYAFGFVHDGSFGRLAEYACYLLGVLGLAVSARRYRDPPHALLLGATIGHIASIPFVPPIDAGLRAYAATAPILGIMVGVGAAAILGSSRRIVGASRVPLEMPPVPVATVEGTWTGAEIFGLALTAAAFGGPLWVLHTSHPPVLQEARCPAGTISVHVRISSGSFLRITRDVPDIDDRPSIVPEIRGVHLRASVSAIELRDDLTHFKEEHTTANLYDLKTGRYVWLVAPTALLPASPGVIQICGHNSPVPLPASYGLFYADTINGIGTAPRSTP
jgi:hypothetical protein